MLYEIETKRLLLGPFRDEDIDRRVELANNFDIARMTANMPYPYTKKDAEEWVAGHEAGRAAGTDFHFAITANGEGLVGAVGLQRKGGSPFDLGYWIGRPYWGKGYASEAAGAVIGWARDTLGVNEITACFFVDNPASGRVLEKLGFKQTGTVCMGDSRARGEQTSSINMIWRDNA